MANSRLCSIPDCGKRHYGLGFCSAHYERFKKYGDPLAGQPPRGSTVQWIRDHANHTGEDCLTWPYSRTPNGYGCVTYKGRRRSASRIMCEIAHGAPPTPKHEAAHSCGKGHEACMNPSHLSWKTHTDNQMDRHDHGTACRGDEQWMSKLTEADVRVIRSSRFRLTQDELAARFGISSGTVAKIQLKQRWGWLR